MNGSVTQGVYTGTKYNYGDDSRGEVIVDDQDNVYIAAPTTSPNFPVSAAAFQPNKSPGQDGVVVKMSPDLTTRIWASYFGGNQEDAIHTIKLDANNNVYIAGGTRSNNLPTTNGVFQPFYIGDTDGFVAHIAANGQSILECTYLGTNSYDQVYLMDLDRDGDVYVVGQSTGLFPIVDPLAGTIYQVGSGRQFVAKYSPDLGNIIFSTRFGSPNGNFPNISPTAFLVDVCDNMYITGWGGQTNLITGSPNQGNTNGLPVTSDAYDSSTDGSDFYLMVLDRDAQNLVYGSFFGSQTVSEHVDGGTSRFDKNGVVYHAVCAGCGGSSTFPTTPGVVSTSNNSSNCNLAIFKLAFDLAGVEAEFTPLDENNQPILTIEGCAPLLVNFRNESFEGATPTNVSYFWDFGYGGGTSTNFEPIFLYPEAGVYEVMLIITDSASCNITDTTFRTITVVPPPEVDAGPDFQTCPGDTVVLQTLSPAASYSWSPAAFVVGDPNQPTVNVRVPSSSRFILTITDSTGCTASDTVFISTDNALTVIADPDTVICRGGNAPLGVDVQGNRGPIVSYQWTTVPVGAPISDPTVANPFTAGLDTTTLFIVEVEDSLGCTGVDTMRIEVFEVFTLEDTFICRGDTITISTNNGLFFSWTPDDGTISAVDIASPQVWPDQTTIYTVEAQSIDGCISVKDIEIEVRDNPIAGAGDDQELCIGESVRLNATGGETYSWTPILGLSTADSASTLATPDLSTNYIVTVTDTSGCSDEDTVLVTVHPLPNIDAGEDATICEQEEIQLQATGGEIYEWTPTQGLSDPSISNPVASPTDTILYRVSALDQNGCQNQDSILISVIPKPITTVDGVNLCSQGFIELTAQGGDSYIWSTGDSSAVIQVTPDQRTTYTVNALVGNCVGFPDTITVDAAFGYPSAAFDYTLNSNFAPQLVDIINTSTGAIRYEWDPGFGNPTREENPQFGYPGAGTYTIQLIAYSVGDCPDTAIQVINLDNVTLLVPSAFTPNFDDHNDQFIIGYRGIRSLNVQIFSRWGMKIFEADSPDFFWDGTYRDRPVPEGVYVFVIRAVGENDQQYVRKGTVTLVR